MFFDSNVGWNSFSSWDSGAQSWMWKRHAGFDVVTYKGNGSSSGDTNNIPHGLNQIPEMAWIKNRDSSQDWGVYHKDMHSSIPQKFYMKLNTNDGRTYEDQTFDSPTATYFNLRHNALVNANNADFIMMLFASVDGISKVGYYTGNGTSGSSTQTISTGFAPRFLIIKRTDTSNSYTNWAVFDTVRGWGSGNDQTLTLNRDNAQGSADFGAPTSTGFTLLGDFDAANANNGNYIYSAHA